VPGLVKPLEGEPGGQRTIADDRKDFVIFIRQVAGFCKSNRG